MRLTPKLLTLLSGGSPAAAYNARVLATSPLRYNKLNETSGTSIVDSSGNAYTGTYTGVDLANADSPFLPNKAPFWDGVNDYGNLYSASFGAAFSFDEITLMWWQKVNSSAFWTDGAAHRILLIQRDATNYFDIRKSSTNGTLLFERTGNSTAKTVSIGSQSGTGWECFAVSASIAGGGLLTAGDLRAYKNGVEMGTVQTGNIAAAGSGLSSTLTLLGAATQAPSNVFHGWFSNLLIWNRPIDAAILALMTA